MRLGLEAAQGDILCYTNSARTEPQDLVLLLYYALTNPDAVIKANRKIREHWSRRLGSLLPRGHHAVPRCDGWPLAVLKHHAVSPENRARMVTISARPDQQEVR